MKALDYTIEEITRKTGITRPQLEQRARLLHNQYNVTMQPDKLTFIVLNCPYKLNPQLVKEWRVFIGLDQPERKQPQKSPYEDMEKWDCYNYTE